MRRSTFFCSCLRCFAPAAARGFVGIRILCLAAWVALAATSVAAGDEIFILDGQGPTFDLQSVDLVAAVPGATGPVLAMTPTGRGALTDLGGVYRYQPMPEFFDLGTDSFHFEVATPSGSTWATAFLVAGMQGDGAFFMPLDDPAELEAVEISGGSSVSLNSVDPIDGPFDLRIELTPGTVGVLKPLADPRDVGNEPVSGGTNVVIDPDEVLFIGEGGELEVAVAVDAADKVLSRILLIDGAAGPEIVGEVLAAGGGFHRSAAVALTSGQHWRLEWWGATAAGSRDAGLMLRADGVMTQLLTGLDGERRVVEGWRFGALSDPGWSGSLQLDNLVGEAVVAPPRLQPVFADNFEAPAPVWSAESCGSLPLPSVTQGELTLPLDPAVGNCFLSRSFAAPQRQHRVRFTVDLTSASLAPLDRVSLLRGVRAGDATGHLQVRVRRNSGGTLQIRADAELDGGSQQNLPWSNLPEVGERRVEVHWWAAASGQSDGGLRLTVDGALVAEALGLANGTFAVDELRLGAMSVGAGSSGQVTFGGIEVWR
ncbi:MAG: hypothetical protein AAF657_20190 [Acidobacteriota bacterium]